MFFSISFFIYLFTINKIALNQMHNKMAIFTDRNIRNKSLMEKPKQHYIKRQHFKNRQNPEDYIQQIFLKACSQRKVEPLRLTINDLEGIISEMGLLLTTRQIHQLYLYATYESAINNVKKAEKPRSLVNSRGKNINMVSLVKWINRRMLKNKISLAQDKEKHDKRQSKHFHTQSHDINFNPEKLPSINKPVTQFVSEINGALQIFSEMQKERQNAGLQPICISSDEEEELEAPGKEIHYQGEFFEVNRKLADLRNKAKHKIEKVILAAKNDKILKKKFEDAIERYCKIRTQTNEKIGRCGAMKAQKRIFDKQKAEIQKIEEWRLKTNQTQLQPKYY